MWTSRPDPPQLNPGRLNGHPTPRRPLQIRAGSGLPHVVVNDIGADVKVDLATLSPGGQPLLVWFWAPH